MTHRDADDSIRGSVFLMGKMSFQPTSDGTRGEEQGDRDEDNPKVFFWDHVKDGHEKKDEQRHATGMNHQMRRTRSRASYESIENDHHRQKEERLKRQRNSERIPRDESQDHQDCAESRLAKDQSDFAKGFHLRAFAPIEATLATFRKAASGKVERRFGKEGRGETQRS